MNDWYKIASEYVGPDATYSNPDHIQTNVINRLQDADGGGANPQFNSPYYDMKMGPSAVSSRPFGVPEKCPVCKTKIEDFEIMKGLHNEKKETVFKCNNCGYCNDRWDIKVSPSKKKPSRIKKRRKRSNFQGNYTIAATPATLYPNPANTPFGRSDFSEDTRVIPWEKAQDDYESTWNTQKQKKRVDYKFKVRKDKRGKERLVKVKDHTSQTGVQPSNTYTQKGDIKKQPRYEPELKSNKRNDSGAWPHNRAPDPSSGWYQSDEVVDKNKFNADMRERVTLWEDHIQNRPQGAFTLSKPF